MFRCENHNGAAEARNPIIAHGAGLPYGKVFQNAFSRDRGDTIATYTINSRDPQTRLHERPRAPAQTAPARPKTSSSGTTCGLITLQISPELLSAMDGHARQAIQ